jgi:hypothetical protein
MALAAIINPSSGSVPPDAAALLEAALTELGHQAKVEIATGESLSDLLRHAVGTQPDALIVWAGDGTLATVLETVGPGGPPVLALPGGTMNLLHKSIHGQTDWQLCLSTALKGGTKVTIPAGCVEGRRFYVAAMIGNLTHLAESREALREGKPLQAVGELAQNPVLDLHTALQLRATLPGEAGVEEIPATAAGILPAVAGACLELGAIDPSNILELTATAIAALSRDWREVDGIARRIATQIDVRQLDGQEIHATLDGEPLMPETTFTRLDAAATVLSARVA